MSDKKEVDWCDWCSEFPKYISVYENGDYKEETFLCKKCYEEYEQS